MGVAQCPLYLVAPGGVERGRPVGGLRVPLPEQEPRVANADTPQQSVGISQGYYFFNAAPYILTLFIMITAARSSSSARDVPGELSITK